MILQIDRRIVRPVVTLPDDVQRAYEPSRRFVRTSSEYLNHDDAIVGAPPFSMGCWFYPLNFVDFQLLMGSAVSGTDENRQYLYFRGDIGGDPVAAFTDSVVDQREAESTLGTSVPGWHHAGGVWGATNYRAAYFDGANKGTETTNLDPVGLDRFRIGVRPQASGAGAFDGWIFWPCTWQAALTDGEWAALGNRATPTPPWEIRPESIVSMPNMRTLHDPFLRALWTPTGTRPANPPWLWRPRQVSMYVPAVGTVAKHVIQAYRRTG